MSRQFSWVLVAVGALAVNLAHAQSAESNPYTGQALSFEQLTRELETAKAQTAVLEERVKQAQLSMTLNVVPVKERAELRQLEMQANPPPPPVITPPAATPKKVTKQVVPAPAPAPPPRIGLSSVIRVNNELTAILDVNGYSLMVKDQESTPYGTVSIVDETRIRLGNQDLTVRGFTISRVNLSDKTREEPTLGSPQGVSRLILPPPLPIPAPGAQLTGK